MTHEQTNPQPATGTARPLKVRFTHAPSVKITLQPLPKIPPAPASARFLSLRKPPIILRAA